MVDLVLQKIAHARVHERPLVPHAKDLHVRHLVPIPELHPNGAVAHVGVIHHARCAPARHRQRLAVGGRGHLAEQGGIARLKHDAARLAARDHVSGRLGPHPAAREDSRLEPVPAVMDEDAPSDRRRLTRLEDRVRRGKADDAPRVAPSLFAKAAFLQLVSRNPAFRGHQTQMRRTAPDPHRGHPAGILARPHVGVAPPRAKFGFRPVVVVERRVHVNLGERERSFRHVRELVAFHQVASVQSALNAHLQPFRRTVDQPVTFGTRRLLPCARPPIHLDASEPPSKARTERGREILAVGRMDEIHPVRIRHHAEVGHATRLRVVGEHDPGRNFAVSACRMGARRNSENRHRSNKRLHTVSEPYLTMTMVPVAT